MIKADYLFIGAGASTTLLLQSLKNKGLLKGKSIVIIDPDSKKNNDKTYCFWSTDEELVFSDCKHLINHTWSKAHVNDCEIADISPLRYHHITGMNVYNELRSIINEYNIQREFEAVINISENNSDTIIETKSNTYTANYIFDSRAASFSITKENQCTLYQSFIGYTIQTENEINNHDSVCIMDFNVEQLNHTQFIYTLPFNTRTALVEITRFGSEIIRNEEAEPLLEKYILEKYGEYKIEEIEQGCIPMSNAHINNTNYKNVINIGSRAGAIKPSTGYAFKRMHAHSEKISESLKLNNSNVYIEHKNRFRFYDRLLLLILKKQPKMGKPIFEKLFSNNKLKNVLQFIDEQSSITQDIKILSSLPFYPFIKELAFDLKIQLAPFLKSFILILFSLLLLFVHKLNIIEYKNLELILISIGLFFVGIPHGALDNIVESNDFKNKISLKFIAKYILKSIAVIVLWFINAKIALFVFLFYSAWHFGETDFKEWNIKKKSPASAVIWGIAVLSIILLSHLPETINIISYMGINVQSNITINPSYVYALILGCILWALYQKNANMMFIVILLTLSIQLPLLSSFALYFIGNHSTSGWNHLKKDFKVKDSTLFKKALPYNIAAWMLLIAFYQFYNKELISSFFVFISSLSLPHVLIMSKHYNHSNFAKNSSKSISS